MMFHRRIQRCWLFPCQLFHMQLSPLLTLPLMLDHRWKSSSHPADASDFHECFLFNSQRENSSRTSNFIDVRENLPLLSFFFCYPPYLFIFFYHHTYLLCSNRVQKKERGQEKSQRDRCVYNKEKNGICLSHLHVGLSAPQTFNLSSCDPLART